MAYFYEFILFAFVGVIYAVIKLLDTTDVPKIKNLPSIPGVPIFGNLIQLGEEHAKNAAKWANRYGPVFQVRLGNRRIVFANTYDSVKHIWITNQSALISRPTLHTFHSVLSSSQGFTIGTSPWDESCKRRRKAAATALNRPSVRSYIPFIDLEAYTSIKELYTDACVKHGEIDINPTSYFQRFALNLSLTLCYGFRIDGSIENELLNEIITVERGVSTLRSTSNNWQDYLPFLRLFSTRSKEAEGFRKRRDKYLSMLLKQLQEQITNGTDRPCIASTVIKDPEAKLNEGKVSTLFLTILLYMRRTDDLVAEVKSICVTMIAGGLDTTPTCIALGVAYLASSHGQEIQIKAYEEILKVYPDGDAWEKCLIEEKVDYVTAVCKEILRFWTVLPLSLPRASIKDIKWGEAIIPAGTTFVMNAWAADYDGSHFKDPNSFRPERYLNFPEASGTPHYAYGAGSRMCAGSHLANRELYIIFIRLFCAFQINPGNDPSEALVLDALECNSHKTSLTTEPRDFKLRFSVRGKISLEKWFRGSEERTRHLKSNS